MPPALEPFDRYPADAGALSDSAQRLAECAAHAIDAGRVTLGAFGPAPQHWDGVAAPELLAAPRPVRDAALALSDSLSWASVAMQFWSMKVRAFNERVSEIRDGLAVGRSRIVGAGGDAVSAAERAHALHELELQARHMWQLAYHVDIVAGARNAAAMLRDGPTGLHVAAAALVGLLPYGQPWNPLGPIARTFHSAGLSPYEIPFPLVPLDHCPLDDEHGEAVVEGATDGADLANALQLPFKDGLLQMLGNEVGDAGVDAVNDETGSCITPLDVPQPPRPPDPPGFLEQLWIDSDAWVDQALEDVGTALEDGPWGLGGPTGGPRPIRLP